jgi:hypothetical protein
MSGSKDHYKKFIPHKLWWCDGDQIWKGRCSDFRCHTQVECQLGKQTYELKTIVKKKKGEMSK